MTTVDRVSAGGDLPAPDPDMPCCMASAIGDRCTCWIGVLDQPRTVDVQDGPAVLRRRLCHDCAYRPGSPERADEDGALPSYRADQPFWCHQGMPKVVAYEHPSLPGQPFPAGELFEVESDYQPVQRAGRAWKADGSPGELCAGWAAANRLRGAGR